MPQVNHRYRIVPQDMEIIIGSLTLAQQQLESSEAGTAYEGADLADAIALKLRHRQIVVLLGRIKSLKKRFERALAS
jgi:hypothetical protein